ncbi:MAG: hypothetical protein EA397_14305 [Deltaproteobacteria bacterium]|nr:MAG: hypothetical protein EA397_14305 [Deltaproteobacteria bacterium]
MSETLTQILHDETRRWAVARDGAQLVADEVASRSGLRAAALKAGFKTIRRLKPGIIEEAMYHLLPSFAPKVDPHWERAVASGDPSGYFDRHAAAIAESLLEVTDAKAQQAKNRVMLKVYRALRGQALAHTAQSVPRLPALIAKHVAPAP